MVSTKPALSRSHVPAVQRFKRNEPYSEGVPLNINNPFMRSANGRSGTTGRALTAGLFILLVGCQTKRQVTLPNGASYSDNGHLAGDTLVMMKPDGSVILRNKMNEPFRDLTQAVVGGLTVHEAGLSNRLATSSATAEVLGAQKAGVAGQKINAGVQMFESGEQTKRILGTTLPK